MRLKVMYESLSSCCCSRCYIYVDSIVVDVAVAIVVVVGCGGAVATIFMK